MATPSNPPAPPNTQDVFQGLLDSLQSNVGRYVTFVLTPLLLPLVGAGGLWLQDKIGFDIQTVGGVAGVVGFVVSVVGGTAAAIVTWLRNRGNHEKAAVEAVTVLKAGEDAVASAVGGPGYTLSGSGGTPPR